MIHIFNGCKMVCGLPGMACRGIGELCGSMNCTAIKDCCTGAGKACTQFVDKPLSSFVVITVILSLTECWYLWGALGDGTAESCTLGSGAWVGIKTWIYVQGVFAILNLVFAPYFQNQVWKQILADAKETGYQFTGPKLQLSKLSKNLVQGSFKTVFLNDFSVLFYFFAMLASFVWSWMGGAWIAGGGEACGIDGYAGWSYYIGLIVFWVAVLFSLFWYCCECCASSVDLTDHIDEY